MFTKANWNRTVSESFKALSAILLIAFYFIGNTQVEVFHEFLHHHDSIVVHTFEAEKDPCHRSLFHRDKNDGCEHKTHLTTAYKCKLCSFFCHSDHLIVSNSFSEFTPSDCILISELKSVQLTGDPAQQSSRAPPAA